MSRSQRLLALMQVLRRHRHPIQAHLLAEELRISTRTLYRDIATLRQQGADIQGEAGVGYVLRPGFMLPPLMFTRQEIAAIVLGSRWVAKRADLQLADAANEALAKISAVLPADLRTESDTLPFLIGPAPTYPDTIDLSALRQAIQNELKVKISYRDDLKQTTQRVIWPFGIGYFEQVRVILAWCELRGGFRHFRTDRILSADTLKQHHPQRRHALLKQWHMEQNINS